MGLRGASTLQSIFFIIIAIVLKFYIRPSHGRVGRVGRVGRGGRVCRVTDCGVRGLGFISPGSILTSRTETSSLSRVVRDGWDQSSDPLSG